MANESSPCSCGCTLSAEDLYKIDKTAMAEILAMDSDTGVDLKPPVATGEDINELVRQVANVDNELEGEEEEEEELTLELEEILKTCDVIQTKVGREVDEKTEQGSI